MDTLELLDDTSSEHSGSMEEEEEAVGGSAPPTHGSGLPPPLVTVGRRQRRAPRARAAFAPAPAPVLPLAVPPLQREDRGPQRRGELERRQRLPHAVDGEVEDGGGAGRREGGLVVGERGGLGGVEGAEPHAGAPARGVPDLGGERAPRPRPHPDEEGGGAP